MAKQKLSNMAMPELLQLRNELQSIIAGKVEAERRELQRQMDELSALVTLTAPVQPIQPAVAQSGNGSTAPAPAPRQRKRTKPAAQAAPPPAAAAPPLPQAAPATIKSPLKGRQVAPKYRDPANPAQTWAGRGRAPHWLATYENAGRNRAEFLIAT